MVPPESSQMEGKGQLEQRGVCGGHCVSCSAWKAVEEEVGWEMAFLRSYKSDSLV